jgi:putative DNA primase/helicase
VTFEDFVARFRAVKRIGDREVKVRCPLPAHRDSDPSVTIKLAGDRLLLYDHAGCRREDVVAAVGCSMADLFVSNGAGPSRSKIVKVYRYTDELGELLYESCRLEPKSFRQRRPDDRGGHVWSLRDVRRVPYRLQDLQEQALILVTEGEKDADNLWALGLAATTNAGGVGKGRPRSPLTSCALASSVL